MAGLLYDSLFGKLLTLPDGTLIHPAHGHGSFCGSGMSTREISTIGYERAHNPALRQRTRQDFVQAKLQERLEKPPYFSRMEEGNLHGVLLEHLPDPERMTARDFQDRLQRRGMIAVDVRQPEAYGGAHVPGAWSLSEKLLGHFAGWFLSCDRPLGLIVNDMAQCDAAIRALLRVGISQIDGYLVAMDDWANSGLEFAGIPQISIHEVMRRRRDGTPFLLLDVRSAAEFSRGHLPGAQHCFVGLLPTTWRRSRATRLS